MVKDEVVSVRLFYCTINLYLATIDNLSFQTEVDLKQETKEDLTAARENTMNDTFTILSDEGNLSNSEPIEDLSFTKNEDGFSVSTLSPFNSDTTDDFVVNRNINERSHQEQGRLSISQKLSKSIKRAKPQKLTNTSKITKNSMVGLSRTPKISGSKAIHLYEFLTDKQFGSNSPNNLSQTNNSTDVFDTPPSNSSTPKILKNHVINSLLKSTLKKNTVTFGNTTNINSDSSSEDTVRKVSRGKMPNFALIHKKQFDKMENISDYQYRKNRRAKILLSGNKSLPDISTKVTPTNKAIKRELMISFNRTPRKIEEMKYEEESNEIIAHRPLLNDSKPKILPAECLKSAMRKEKLRAENQVAQQDVKMKGKKVTMNISPDKILGCDRPGFPVRKTPFKESSNVDRCLLNQKKINLQLDFEEESKPSRQGISSTNKNKLCSNQTGMQRDNNIALVKDRALIKNQSSKDYKTTGKAKVWMPAFNASSNAKSGYMPSKEKTGYTRFGFSVPVKKKKEDIVKAVVNKTRLPANDQAIEEKRAVIKGVRSNRRFDLLMKMRLNK